ncbi:glycosyltransferase family 2 protein [Pedobacter frigiditerrae]|uniref:glycosyltransferase family 2 protein n=1 Tax=Pedobacter frigiditerrae TaxID=2530452 RepID=UPI00292E6990|nr:glycosyltransferase family 2 protein [Pedobacter frigiditerrae]
MIDKNNKAEEVILTIAIPTYNRYDEVQTQVRLLLPQLSQQVNLVVYDNCSTIPISEYFSKEELLKFKLVRNKVNVGADANIARCFENCETTWLWTLSDDDFVKENAVETIIQQIESKREALFFCFWEKEDFETRNFEELSNKFKSGVVYCDSFTMSRCLYNMSMLKYSLIDYYANISSMVGTMILVLKYVEKNDSGNCIYLNKAIIEKWNEDVGWNYERFINRSFLFLDAFGTKYNKRYQKTLFIGHHITNYSLLLLDRKSSNVGQRQKLHLLKFIIGSQGLLNAIRYTPTMFFKALMMILSKNAFFTWIPFVLNKTIPLAKKIKK